MNERGIIAHLARFAGALREQDIPIVLLDEIDAAKALTLIDLFDRREVQTALRVALKIQRRHWEKFDRLFDDWWVEPGVPPQRRPDRPMSRRRPGRHRMPGPRAMALSPVEATEDVTPEGEVPGYSPEALLRRKPFDECSPQDLADMEQLLVRLAKKLATRKSRRLVPTKGRGMVDLRRSLRHAVGTGGEVLTLARRARTIDRPRLVLLCDTSGSMDPHTRFLLMFVLALNRVVRRAEVFAFNTELTRLTPWLSRGMVGAEDLGATLERLARGVPDWSGGTRIGESLAEFVSEYQDSVVDSRTIVVILSDGLDCGEPAVLERGMRAIQMRAHKVIWLNPLLGDPRYRPTARGMEAALPFVDHFASAHNLESLERLVPLLAA